MPIPLLILYYFFGKEIYTYMDFEGIIIIIIGYSGSSMYWR